MVPRRRGHQGPAEPQTGSRRVPETPSHQSPVHHQRQPPPPTDPPQQPHTPVQRSGISRPQIGHAHTLTHTPAHLRLHQTTIPWRHSASQEPLGRSLEGQTKVVTEAVWDS